MRRLFGYLFLLLLLTSCGGGGGGANSIQNISQPLVSVFVNSPAKGVRFNTSSGLSGVTNENGEFHYRVGDSVEFSLELGGDKIIIGSKTFSSAQPETSVLSLSGNGIDPLAVSQVLQTLDVGTVVGKMDFTGINLPVGLRSTIQEALVSTAAASSRVANIAGGLLSNGYSPKNGSNGVDTAEAISRLSTQTANQIYLNKLISTITEDVTPLSVVYDRTYFVISYFQESNGESFVSPEFELIKSDGTFDMMSPGGRYYGTYTSSQDGKTGEYTDYRNRSGSFRIKVGSAANFFLDHTRQDGLRGYMTGNLLSSLQVSDFFGKSISLTNGCSNGVDGVFTFSNNGTWSSSCGTVGKIKSTTTGIVGDRETYCNTLTRGFLRPTPNTVCMENHTANTASLIGIISGSLSTQSGSGTIVRVTGVEAGEDLYDFIGFSY